MLLHLVLFFAAFCGSTVSAALTVTLDNVIVTGIASGSVNKWLGIPFAVPPTGDLRLRLPQPISSYNTSFSATAYGPSCPEQSLVPLPADLPAAALESITAMTSSVSSEDCLTLNVIAPADATPESNLPVVVWIYGGGFVMGGTSNYDGSLVVATAIDLNVPAIFVSMNYRWVSDFMQASCQHVFDRGLFSMSAFGFLASEEVKQAGVGNIGLQDQRQAMRWVQKYISAFGGDPTKVTIWGQSAGAMSVGIHMVANNGNPEGLFRAAFMESGSPLPVGDITRGQPYYDFIVDQTGCTNSSDTLQCLREAPYATLMDAINQTPNFLGYIGARPIWLPRVDGVFLTANPQELVSQGSIADIPFVTSDCDDEGTMFSFGNTNITTSAQFEEYVQTVWFPDAPSDSIQTLMGYYSDDITQGSPFDTGDLDALTLEFKRIAAFQGDAMMQSQRRFLLENRFDKQNTWAFLFKRFKSLLYLGSFHGSSLPNSFGGGDMTSRLVYFVANLDPNGGVDLEWPKWNSSSPYLLTFLDGLVPQVLTSDTYRAEAISYLIEMNLNYPN
ncbi:Alpha/Beta hydrolase protein [Suillus ampliporus]|nr:Alpha/Beta hydrolase protein [Suillus ampliporus]